MKKFDPITETEWLLCNEFNRKLRDEFIEQSTHLSIKSQKAYYSNLAIWFNYIRTDLDNKKHTDIKSRDYMKFQNMLYNNGRSSADISNKRSAISSLNNYIMTYYEDQYPTFRNFIHKGISKPEKSDVRIKNPPTKAEMEMLIADLEKREEWQKIAYLKFTFETSCRREESRLVFKNIVNAVPVVKMIKVKNEDGIEEDKEVKYYLTHKLRTKGRGRTGKLRALKFGDYSMDAIKKWLEVRGEDDCPYLFISSYGKEITQTSESTFNSWCNSDFSKVLGRRLHPHALREARATSIVVEEGKSIETAQRLLGHNSAETTKIYIIKDDSDDESDELFI